MSRVDWIIFSFRLKNRRTYPDSRLTPLHCSRDSLGSYLELTLSSNYVVCAIQNHRTLFPSLLTQLQ